MQGYQIILQISIFFMVQIFASCVDGPIVETPLGKIKGFTMTSREGRQFFAFKGIPFAQPPIGQLRFQPPEPKKPWSGVLPALEEGDLCMQVSMFDPMHTLMGFEDCLHLSVFTKNFSGHSPVLVQFHGGAFTSGGNIFYGPEYLMDEDMVVVVPNYRLGILGFLSFETPEMPGNQGMKDQVEALRWIQKNIASFGGNPNLVTLIGESAGGGSVYNHILSPLSRGLFHRGVAMSGSTYSPWAVSPPGFPKSRAERLLTLLNCPPYEKNGLQCLLKINSTEIVSKFVDFFDWQIDPAINFGPGFEPPGPGAFFSGPFSKLEHNPVPLMMGLNSAEGLLRLYYLLMENTDFKWYSENFNKLAPKSLLYFSTASKPDELTPKIRKYYLPKEEISLDDWTNLTKMHSDSWFNIGTMEGADKHTGDVYLYYFDYIMQGESILPLEKEYVIGSFHVSDLGLVWNLSITLVPNIDNDYEVTLSKAYIKFLINFMLEGNPVSQQGGIKWQKWTKNDHNYLHIRKGEFISKKGFNEDSYKFWKSLNYRDNFEKGFHGS